MKVSVAAFLCLVAGSANAFAPQPIQSRTVSITSLAAENGSSENRRSFVTKVSAVCVVPVQ
jgi:hypothetical protein